MMAFIGLGVIGLVLLMALGGEGFFGLIALVFAVGILASCFGE